MAQVSSDGGVRVRPTCIDSLLAVHSISFVIYIQDVSSMTEEEQLALALQMSMASALGGDEQPMETTSDEKVHT